MTIEQRIRRLPWQEIEESLWRFGFAKTPAVLTPEECAGLVGLYADASRFRSRIEMERYRFGVGDYQYFANPLPEVVQELRAQAYPFLAPIASRWMEALGIPEDYPAELSGLAARCRKQGQSKPTPLLLHYEAGGYNCLHQDIYGDVVFPLQLTCFLSRRGVDYEGGDFLLVEQRPRAQSRGDALATEQGETVVFTTRYRPVKGSRGYYRANIRHGVSRVRSGTRYTLGIIFHDAK